MPAVVDPDLRQPIADREAIGDRLRAALPDRLRAELTRRGWRTPDLAALAGLSPEAVRRWLRGEGLPGLAEAVAIAEALGVRLGWLIEGEAPAER